MRDIDDKTALDAIQCFLSERGFSVDSLGRSDHKTPDFCVRDGSDTYIIEVKRRFDIKSKTGLRMDRIARLNTMSRRVKNAAAQLESKSEPSTLNLLWVLGEPPHENTFYDQLRATLYGIRPVVGLRDGESVVKACFYADHSDFYRHRHVLDGAIVGAAAAVFVNDLSARADRFKHSKLCQLAQLHIEDPREYEKSDAIMVFRSSVDRSDEAAVLREIEQVYELENAQFEKITKFSTFL